MRSLTDMLLRAAPLALCLTLASRDANAQTVRALVLEGDEIFGIGTVTSLESFTISDNGEWLVLVDTNHIPTSQDFVLLRNGIPTVQEGDLLISPEGATVRTMKLPSFNIHGDIGWALSLGNVSASSDNGCFFNSQILIQEGMVSSSSGFSPGTVWRSFTSVRLNDHNQILLRGAVDDPMIDTVGDAALVRLALDEYGYLLLEEVMMKEGTLYGGLTSPAQTMGSGSHDMMFNNRGEFMVFVDTTDATNLDGNIFLNYTSVAQEGKNAPVFGRKWTNLSAPELDLNDYGDYIHTGAMDGDGTTNSIIVVNGEKLVQEGDVVAGVAPFSISNFHSAPVFITNSGRPIWFAQFREGDASRNKGIFLDDQLIVQIGVTRVGLRTIRTIRTFAESFHVPPNGQHLVFLGTLDDGTTGIFHLDMGAVVPMDGCYGNAGELIYDGGMPLTGSRVELLMDNGQGPGVTPILLLSTLPVTGWPPCGFNLGGIGELLIEISAGTGNPAFIEFGAPWNGVPVPLDLDIPDEAGLVGARVYAQGLFWDIGNAIPEQNFRLTNGLEIIISSS